MHAAAFLPIKLTYMPRTHVIYTESAARHKSGAHLIVAVHVRVHAFRLPLLDRHVSGRRHESPPDAIATQRLLHNDVQHKGALAVVLRSQPRSNARAAAMTPL